MKILDIIRNDEDLQEKISLVCDFEVYDEYDDPYDYFDAEFTMDGKIFGGTDDDGWFVLLEDNTIGYITGGDIGRIAENMQEFFSLIINCPSFEDFRLEDLYYEENKELLKKLCNGIAKKDKMTGFVSAEGLMANDDNIHFSSAALREFGARYYAEFLKLEDKNKVFWKKPSLDDGAKTDLELL